MFSNWIEDRLREFLQQTDEKLKLGPGRGVQEPVPATVATEVDHLRDHLVEQLKFRRRLSLGLIAIVVILFAIVFSILVWYVFDRWQTENVLPLIIGQSGSLLALVFALQRFWRDVTATELLVAFLPGVPAERAIEIVRDWFHAKKARRQQRRSK